MNIQLSNLKKTFGTKVAVDIPDFRIQSGQLLGLVGNNGAGKSTLFRLMLDLIKADTGSITMTSADNSISVDVALSEKWKTWTGAYIDESFIIDYLTPDEYLQFVARISNISDEQLHNTLQRYEHFMAGEVAGQKKLIRNLSAGNKQKVGIIAALLTRPQLLILDEPFNFLDPSSQNAMKHFLQEYNRESQATILISSHNLSHTIDICPRIALLEQGHIIRDIDNRDGSAAQELEHYFEVVE